MPIPAFRIPPLFTVIPVEEDSRVRAKDASARVPPVVMDTFMALCGPVKVTVKGVPMVTVSPIPGTTAHDHVAGAFQDPLAMAAQARACTEFTGIALIARLEAITATNKLNAKDRYLLPFINSPLAGA